MMTQELPEELKDWMTEILIQLTDINAGISMLIKEQNSSAPEIIDRLDRINASVGDLTEKQN